LLLFEKKTQFVLRGVRETKANPFSTFFTLNNRKVKTHKRHFTTELVFCVLESFLPKKEEQFNSFQTSGEFVFQSRLVVLTFCNLTKKQNSLLLPKTENEIVVACERKRRKT
tara:strand:- start:78 stop:413 length:336 start_codon:yes stop_codon:yes gene_type:complete